MEETRRRVLLGRPCHSQRRTTLSHGRCSPTYMTDSATSSCSVFCTQCWVTRWLVSRPWEARVCLCMWFWGGCSSRAPGPRQRPPAGPSPLPDPAPGRPKIRFLDPQAAVTQDCARMDLSLAGVTRPPSTAHGPGGPQVARPRGPRAASLAVPRSTSLGAGAPGDQSWDTRRHQPRVLCGQGAQLSRARCLWPRVAASSGPRPPVPTCLESVPTPQGPVLVPAETELSMWQDGTQQNSVSPQFHAPTLPSSSLRLWPWSGVICENGPENPLAGQESKGPEPRPHTR